MASNLPRFVSDRILQLTLDYTPVAYLLIGDDGRLKDLGGELRVFGLEYLTLGSPAQDQALFLKGMLPLEQEPLLLPAVELGVGKYADIHLLPDDAGDWVILFDKSKAIRWRATAQQKSNELSLLRQEVAQSETRHVQHTSVTEYPSGLDYCNALNMLPLEPLDDGSFRLLGPVPVSFQPVYPEIFQNQEGLHPDHKFPFIENFLIDARKVWENDNDRRKSGPWVETDRLGKEYALEATAASWKEKKILLIELLDDVYEEHRSFLQMGRENALVRHFLEGEVRRRTAEIRVREEEVALRLVWATESRDDGETGSHIRRIGLYSEAMAGAIGWPQSVVDDIRIAATMHDIGKIGIPDSILRKPGPLTMEEYEVMKSHALIGGNILSGSEIALLRMAKEIALGHHEKWNGSGYPNQLAGKEIPLSARIVAIADVFDALVHDRVYKQGMTAEKAISIMQKHRGLHFDPDLFDVFIGLQKKFVEIANDLSVPMFEGFSGS